MSKQMNYLLDELDRLKKVAIDMNENMNMQTATNSLMRIKLNVREIRKHYEEIMERIK